MGSLYFLVSLCPLNTHYEGNHRALNKSNYRSNATIPDVKTKPIRRLESRSAKNLKLNLATRSCFVDVKRDGNIINETLCFCSSTGCCETTSDLNLRHKENLCLGTCSKELLDEMNR